MENGLHLQQTLTEEEHLPPIQELPFSLLPYPQMIMEAIGASGNECNKTAIVKHIESSLTHLPPSHLTLLNYHLNLMKQSGQIVIVKNNYMKPVPNLGRPSKPKGDSSHVAVTFLTPSLRPRRCPPKSKDSFLTEEKTKVPPSVSGRPRGRPPKKKHERVKGDDGAKAQGNNGVVRRGRGRPPKLKLLSSLSDLA